MPPVILSSDSHVFEPPDLWQTRIDAPFRDRAPRIQRIDGADQIVVETDQILSGIGLISNAGARFEAPETISAQGRFEDEPGKAPQAMSIPGDSTRRSYCSALPSASVTLRWAASTAVAACCTSRTPPAATAR